MDEPEAQDSKGSKPSLFDQAKVVSAFMQAFGFAVGRGLRGEKPLKVKVAAEIQAIPEGTSRLWCRCARLGIEDGIALLIESLQAELEVLDPNAPLIPEQPDGYIFKIQTGRIAMDGPSISTLMNRYAFPDPATAPLADVRVQFPDDLLLMTGTFRANRFLSLPLRLTARASVTPEGLIDLVPVEIRAGGFPVDRLMNMLGLELSRLMPAAARSMTFQGDHVLINPLGMFPAPRATGHLVGVEIRGDHMVMRYDDATPARQAPLMEPEAASYLALVGHDLLVGKITMSDVCIQLVPLDEKAGWVELSLPRYREQLAQGESQLNHADQVLYRLPSVMDLKG